MAIGIKIKTNSKHIEKRFKRLQSKFPSIIDKGVLQAGFQLLDIIRTKTAKGITAVDLFYTGRMLSALTPNNKTVRKTGKHKITLGFANAQMRQRALYNQVLNEPKRVFFGFNDRTEKIIQNTFNKFIKKQFRDMKL
jgi:hypothetical protein